MRNKLTQDKPTLFRSQYGDIVVASSRKEFVSEVRSRYGMNGPIFKIYNDKANGSTVWNGYGVTGRQNEAELWFTAFHRREVAR